MESVDETCPSLDVGESLQQPENTRDEVNTGGAAHDDLGNSASLGRLNSFFSSGDTLYPRQFKVAICDVHSCMCDNDYNMCRLTVN